MAAAAGSVRKKAAGAIGPARAEDVELKLPAVALSIMVLRGDWDGKRTMGREQGRVER